jgi:hypothetical protein
VATCRTSRSSAWRTAAILTAGLITALLSIAARAGVQATYYISPTGSDTNPGTLGAPFQTLDHARAMVQQLAITPSGLSGDINVYLRGGTYLLTAPVQFGIADSGNNGYTIAYQNYQNETPILSGGQIITGWSSRTPTDPADKVMKAATGLSSPSRSFYVNEARAYRTHINNTAPAAGWTWTSTGYTTGSGLSMGGYPKSTSIEFIYRGRDAPEQHLWLESRCLMISATSSVITMRSSANDANCFFYTTTPPNSNVISNPTAIENIYEILQNSGEWYLDSSGATTANQQIGILYYVPRSSENMGSALAVVPVLQTLISVSGTNSTNKVRNLRFSGLAFEYTNYQKPSTAQGFSEIQANFTTTAVNKVPAAVVLHAADNVVVENSHFTHLGGAGLNLEQATNVTIRGNVFNDISSSGIQIGDLNDFSNLDLLSTDDSVLDNYIHDIGLEFRGAVGIWAGYTRSVVIAHNQLDNLPYTGISMGWGWGAMVTEKSAWRNQIFSNLIFDGLQTLADGACIYDLGAQSDLIVRGNVCHDMDNFAGALYADMGSQNILYVNNVIWSSSHALPTNSSLDYTDVFFHEYMGPIRMQYSFMDRAVINHPTPSYFPDAPSPAFQSPYPQPSGATLLYDSTTLPASIISTAGLEPAYRYLLPAGIAPTDTTPPTAPTGLTAVAGPYGIQLKWMASSDDVGVTGYEIDQIAPDADRVLPWTTVLLPQNSAAVSRPYSSTLVLAASPSLCVVAGNLPANHASNPAGDLIPNTPYTLAVKARDAAGNLSAGTQITIKTAPASSTTQPPSPCS